MGGGRAEPGREFDSCDFDLLLNPCFAGNESGAIWEFERSKEAVPAESGCSSNASSNVVGTYDEFG